jgi:hypothetical protein
MRFGTWNIRKNGVFWDVTPVLTPPTGLNTPEDAILHSHRRGNLKSYVEYKEFL